MSGNISKKILIGGVPFGTDNVGDEAILECVVSIVRNIWPNAELWVSTDDREQTESKLKVKTVPLFGFEPPGYNKDEMFHTIDSVDAFIWSGATGLSDYPEIPLQLLTHSAEVGIKTAIFCTGMNDQLNPYLYRLLPGGRHRVFSIIKKLSFGLLDFISRFEEKKLRSARALMRHGVDVSDVVILRDHQSLDSMYEFIDEIGRPFLIGADPAIEITPKPIEHSDFPNEVVEFCNKKITKIGLCLSAQSPVKQLNELAVVFDKLFLEKEIHVVGIPMNPITDSNLMLDFKNYLKCPESMVVTEGRYEPDEIAGLAAEMDVVISSRLHLLILASNSLTPFIGISRGSKVTNFTSQFQLPDIGSVEEIDMGKLENEILRLINSPKDFTQQCYKVRKAMQNRLDEAKIELSKLFM